MNKFSQISKEHFQNGYSCSEAVVRAAVEAGMTTNKNINELTKIATVFSGGMSGGCLCGAVAGAQIILGSISGRTNNIEPRAKAQQMAKELIEAFKQINKTTCCKALTAKFEMKMNSHERKQNCTKLVEDSANCLSKVLEDNLINK